MSRYDVVVDGSDNFATRYLSNDVCVFAGKPNIYGSVFRMEGQVTVFAPHLGGPCYRCLFPEPPPRVGANCAEAGVLGMLPGIIGTMQALEGSSSSSAWANPSLVGCCTSMLQRGFREFKVRRDPNVPCAASTRRSPRRLIMRTFAELRCPEPRERSERSRDNGSRIEAKDGRTRSALP